MSRLVVGLDVGIASVGWSVVDIDNMHVKESGVRLFEERSAEENSKRRSYRSSRRLIRRRTHRIERIKNILENEGIIDSEFSYLQNPYEIRVKGLKQELSKSELATAILHIAKRRGVDGDWTVSDDENKAKEQESLKGILGENKSQLKGKYICEIQLNRLESDVDKVRDYKNNFRTEDYILELKQIFKNQTIPIETQEKIINIISSRREYFEGPGGPNSPTIYGRYLKKDSEPIDLIEKMRGKCKFDGKPRAPKNSYSACMFNLLNDLNNVTYNGEKLTKAFKEKIIKEYVHKIGGITPDKLRKELGAKNISEIYGLRIDKNNKPLLSEFPLLKQIFSLIKDGRISDKIIKDIIDNTDLVIKDKCSLDIISEILTNKKGFEERKRTIKETNYLNYLSNNEIEEISNISKISGFHNLSLDIISDLIPDLLISNQNQIELLTQNKYFEIINKNYDSNNIPYNNESILSPVAKRSQQEAIKVLNAIRKKYSDIDSIVIEMARENNSEEYKDKIRKRQKYQEDLNKMAKEIVNKEISESLKIKLKLYKEQDGKTAYENFSIDLNVLINEPKAYEVDHIIPLSISFDNSLNNKVLVTSGENQRKGQKTPYQYMTANGIDYGSFRDRVLENNNYSIRKKQNLLNEKDIDRFELKKEFINRNLVDTRYATKELLNNIKEYFKYNNINTKVYNINGVVTGWFRNKTNINKDREKDSSHHAIDASIIAVLGKTKLLNSAFKIQNDEEFDRIVTLSDDKQMFESNIIEFIDNLNELKPKYSHKVDRKFNKGLSDETIYSTREYNEKEFVIRKIKDIYGQYKDVERILNFFRDGTAKEKLLIGINEEMINQKDKDNGAKTIYKQLYDIYNNEIKNLSIIEKNIYYSKNKINPFLKYKEEHGPIRKFSKDGNGPVVKSIKYIDGQVGDNVADISHKYKKSNRRVIKMQQTPFRIDIYQSKSGERKLLILNQSDLLFEKNKTYISKQLYDNKKEKYNVVEEDDFLFSLYKNDIIKTDLGFIRYAGVKSASSKSLYYKTIDGSSVMDENCIKIRRPNFNINKQNIFEKYHTDILGNFYKNQKESCKLENIVL